MALSQENFIYKYGQQAGFGLKASIYCPLEENISKCDFEKWQMIYYFPPSLYL